MYLKKREKILKEVEKYNTSFYNLDVINAIKYRVNSY